MTLIHAEPEPQTTTVAHAEPEASEIEVAEPGGTDSPEAIDAPIFTVEPPYAAIDALGRPGQIAATDTLPAETLGDGFDGMGRRMRAWLRQWEPVPVPPFEAVRDAHPETERRSSLRSPETRDDGAVRVSASLYDPPTRTGAPLAWSRNWVSVVIFPRVTEPGRLHYRFSVGSRLVLDGQAETSLVSTSLNSGIVADVATASPFDAPGFATPIARPLVAVQCREDADAYAVQEFEGSIDVEAGDTPAMAFVIGTDVLFRDGWVRVHEGSSSWIGPAGAGASGTIETRFTPTALLAMFGEEA
ncbi:hypothetical protein [Agromyces aerolatus]|uniref:hypothetical protein n=1 Tax=Agromyces sp. LY-1074 TaxID=3074080 RepID=UPI002865A301|nr:MULTISPECIES: hypothetical protein [unclassified Agromyces]MDR5700299.1 hypothetical protein [Agromyces sp. LY-1074]MDR5706723.1 hypothetical protein [Agromyces sp. LY-1358]